MNLNLSNSENKPRGLYFSKLFSRGLYSEGNLPFKIDWASLIFGINLPFLLCLTLYLRAIFQVQDPGGLILLGGGGGGNLTEVFLRYRIGGLIFGGAFTWRSLFSGFYGI